MESVRESHVYLIKSTLFGVVFSSVVMILMYVFKIMRILESRKKDGAVIVIKARSDKDRNENVKDPERFNARKDTAAAASIATKKKKNTDNRWTNRTDKQGFSHSWLLTSLKGHTGQVLDMDFASNGKYLASCAEAEPDPGDDLANPTDSGGGGTTSGSDCNKENSSPSSAETSPRAQKPLSRRQRKNRRREDSSSPESKKKSKAGGGAKKAASPTSSATAPNNIPVVSATSADHPYEEKKCCGEKKYNDLPRLVNYCKLNISDFDLYRLFRSYLLSPEQMLTLGYPVECVSHPGRAILFKSPIEVPSYPRSAYKYNKPESKCVFDVNAREFVPNIYKKSAEITSDSGNSSDSNDSESSDGSPVIPRTYQQVLVNGSGHSVNHHNHQQQPSAPVNTSEICQKTCMRCGVDFYMNTDNTYVTQEACMYHWGKLTRVFGENRNNYGVSNEYACCRGKQNSRGCTEGKLHVWNGLEIGFNGPFDNYVKTRPRRTPNSVEKDKGPGAYALDCEMCFSGHGMELVKISVVAIDGKLVYDAFVRPENEIIDYNSRFSGVTAKDMQKKRALKSLKEVQNDLLSFISSETILIGHGLENDLRCLRILHPTVIDTAVSFPHYNGLPYRRSLKSLTSCFLKREIQTATSGHDSYEDSRACMDLMLWRVRKDFRSILDHSCHF